MKSTAKTIQWACRAEVGESLTVGDLFKLSCQGEATQLVKEKLSLRRPKEVPYALKILKVESLTDTSVELTATTYMAGDQATPVTGYGITDGVNTVEFESFSLTTKTVINQEENPEGKPFAAFGPMGATYPLWIWIVAAVVLAVIAGFIVRIYRLSRQRKQFLRELAERSTALAPYHQFQKDLRQITRDLPVSHLEKWNAGLAEQMIDKLDSAFRWFLSREFKVPALKWSPTLVHREIRKIDRKLYRQAEQPLLVADRELRRAKKSTGRTSIHDFQQLLEIVRKAADVIHLQRNQESRR